MCVCMWMQRSDFVIVAISTAFHKALPVDLLQSKLFGLQSQS